MVSRRGVLTAGLGLASGVALTGCGSDTSRTVSWRVPGEGADQAPGATHPVASLVQLTTTPAADSTGIAPTDPIRIAVAQGTIEAVTVAAPDHTVNGALSGDQQSWRSAEPLHYGRKYTLMVSAVDTAGVPTQLSSSFETVTPRAVADVTFQANALAAINDGGTYGVGQPVIVYFDHPVADRAAAERAMLVTTTPRVAGRWRWISNQSAHWRPAEYWTPGTKVKVQVTAFGVHLGNGVYGGKNASAGFTIGPSRIAIADGQTHYMQVFINGALVRSIPVSLGKDGSTKGADGSTIYFATNSGPHVVLTKSPSVQMRSASFGITNPKDPNYYDETIKTCCRISYSGEYVHLADWNIPAHGHTNTSHGCINVGPDHAQWFYNTFAVGDVVEVRNTARRLALTDGLGDWTIPWSQW